MRDPQIDRICQAVALFCRLPIAAVTISQVNGETVRASFGLNTDSWPLQSDRLFDRSFESSTVTQIADTALDARYRNEPQVVNSMPVRQIVAQRMFSYERNELGVFYLLGSEPGELSQSEIDVVARLVRLLASLLELNREPMDAELFDALDLNLGRAIVVTDPNIPDQPITFCNAEFCRLTGYDSAEMLGKNCRFLQGDDVDKMAVASLKSDLALGSCRPITLKNYRKNGSAFWNEMFIAIERDKDKHVRQYIGMIVDVTDRIDTQEVGKLSENVIEDLPFAVFLNDPYTRRYFAVNAVARDLIGYSNEQLRDMGPADIIPELTGDTFLAMVRPILEGSVDELVRRTVCERSDGSRFPMEAVLRRAVIGEREAIVSYCSDITHRQRLERLVNPKEGVIDSVNYRDDGHRRLLRSLRVARSANREKSRFLAAASHDLRQPLHVIGLALDGLAQEGDSGSRSEFSTVIRDSVGVMSEMLEALLDVSRFDSGVIEPKWSKFPIRRLIKRVVANNMVMAQSKGLSLVFDQMPYSVRSDFSLLERVLDNIVANAVRFTESGVIHISAKQQSEYLRISVADTGIGIPPDSIGEIFDEYCQLNNNINSATKGLGLGLSIVKRICNLLATPVHVESVFGEGSTFSVDLELVATLDSTAATGAAATWVPPTAEVVRSDAPFQATVLFVEDNEAIAQSVTTLLQGKGATVQWAADLDGALTLLSTGFRPDIVITDYRLAGADGVQVVHEVRAVVGGIIPALIVTGDAGTNDLVDRLPAHCELFFKPVSFAVLYERLTSFLTLR